MISYSLLFILLSLLRAKPSAIHSHPLLILKIYSQAESDSGNLLSGQAFVRPDQRLGTLCLAPAVLSAREALPVLQMEDWW